MGAKFLNWPVNVCCSQTLTGGYASDFCLFRNLQRVIDLNTQIASCALQLRMAKK